MRRQLAQLPLHTGAAPAYLFGRMWRLAGAITMAVVDEYGPAEMLRASSDPAERKLRSWADYSHAHGGKDGIPHPVDRPTYDRSIAVLTDAWETVKRDALKRLATFGSVR